MHLRGDTRSPRVKQRVEEGTRTIPNATPSLPTWTTRIQLLTPLPFTATFSTVCIVCAYVCQHAQVCSTTASVGRYRTQVVGDQSFMVPPSHVAFLTQAPFTCRSRRAPLGISRNRLGDSRHPGSQHPGSQHPGRLRGPRARQHLSNRRKRCLKARWSRSRAYARAAVMMSRRTRRAFSMGRCVREREFVRARERQNRWY